MKLTEQARLNRTAIICHGLIDMVLLAAYILEYFKGARTIGYTFAMIAFTLIPVIFEAVYYRWRRDSKAIRFIIAVCYLTMYTFVIFTTTSAVAYTYIIPLYMVVILFSDVFYCVLVCGSGLLINVIHMIYYGKIVGYDAEGAIADLEIRIALLVLLGIFNVLSTRVMNKINQEKLSTMMREKEKSDRLLKEMIQTSESMIGGITQSDQHMISFGESVNKIKNAMKEVTHGNTEAADAIQKQQQQTAQIHVNIGKVREAAVAIDKDMAEASSLAADGKKRMDILKQQIGDALMTTESIQQKMAVLSKQTEEMNNIIKLITSVANRTEILALNASIEAARAGEAGKGFAVVAEEVSALANQTKSATIHITKLIRNVTKELTSVAEAVDQMTDDSRANESGSGEALQSFARVEDATTEIARQTLTMKRTVEELEATNRDIVESIQTISAISEEVAAHSSETYDACTQNAELVEDMTHIVKGLNLDAQALKAHTA
jgi:methyl-accepting chemotaxis protein